MSLSATNSSVGACCGIGAVGAQTNVSARRVLPPAVEAWYFTVHIVNIVPPFPVIVDLVVEPNIGTSSQKYLSFPSTIEIFLDDSVRGLHICLWRHRHSGVDFPGVGVSGALALSAAETESDGLAEAGLGKSRYAHLYADCVGVGNAFGYGPCACGRCGSCLLEREGAGRVQSVAVVLVQGERGLGYFLSD